MSSEDDILKKLPLWAQLRIAHDFADDDEKEKLKALAMEIIDEHTKEPGPKISCCWQSCQGSCLRSCQVPCEQSCQKPCEHNCMTSCLHITCQDNCQKTNSCQNINCLNANPCMGACLGSCLGCMSASEFAGCKLACQNTCLNTCEASCLRGCMIPCQHLCLIACQVGPCQSSCQSSCLNSCEGPCQGCACLSTAQGTQDPCQIACQNPCMNICQGARLSTSQDTNMQARKKSDQSNSQGDQ